MHDIRRIPAAETMPLRQQLLRPGLPPEASIYVGDDAPDTLHLGAFDENGKLVGIASVFHEPPAGTRDAGAWRLRGVATLPQVRGRGYGIALVEACITYATEQGGAVAWCNTGINAAGFFEALGFEVDGMPYALQGSGLHYFLQRRLHEEHS